MFFRMLISQLLVLSYGFIRNQNIIKNSKFGQGSEGLKGPQPCIAFLVNRRFSDQAIPRAFTPPTTNFKGDRRSPEKFAINVVCIERPNGSDIPEKREDLPVKKKKFYGAKVGNGMDYRKNDTNYHEIVAKIKENMYKMSLLNQLENENINIIEKNALYNKYQSDYIDKNYTPTKEGSELFEKWCNDT